MPDAKGACSRIAPIATEGRRWRALVALSWPNAPDRVGCALGVRWAISALAAGGDFPASVCATQRLLTKGSGSPTHARQQMREPLAAEGLSEMPVESAHTHAPQGSWKTAGTPGIRCGRSRDPQIFLGVSHTPT